MGLLQRLSLRRSSKWEPPTFLDQLLISPLQFFTTLIYQLVLFLRGQPFRPTKDKRPIRIVCLSDTHDRIAQDVPDGDLLIHSGDLTNPGGAEEIQKQIDWLDSLPHRHKVFVAGNHDSWFDVRSRKVKDRQEGRRVDFKGLHYLQQSSVALDFADGRMLNIYGAGDIPACGGDDSAFQYAPDKHPWSGRIPLETDVLVTHTPPRFHRDLGLGCPGLLEEIWRVRPKLHVFGHIHWGRGMESAYFDGCQRAYETLMSRTPRGPIFDLIPNTGHIEAFKVFYYGFNAIAFEYLMLGPGSNNASLMVNAACMQGNTGKLCKNPAQVVEM
ncbi:putative rhamnogalacturonate lyase C [Cytospora mali]|uniref:Rhamnogalacturonate lyase C n=1 Tax=Cytospora mali TaxID=578113 RepID=A0A194VWW7_CYTMA|nr:putative rhamnogalacturonate lyase C [Valsa mali]